MVVGRVPVDGWISERMSLIQASRIRRVSELARDFKRTRWITRVWPT
jgi:hypothetical protein